MKRLTTLLMDDEGQSLVEYGLILALIAVVVVGVLSGIGTNLTTMFTTVKDKIVPPGS